MTSATSSLRPSTLSNAQVKELLLQAQQHVTQQQFDEARVCLQQVILAHPTLAAGYVDLTKIEMLAGDFAAAAQSARRALYFAPEDTDALALLVDALRRQGNFGEALKPIIALLSRNPTDKKILEIYAMIVTQLPLCEEEKAARPLLEKALKAKPPLAISLLMQAAINRQIATMPVFRQIMALLRSDAPKAATLLSDPATLAQLADPLLLSMLDRFRLTATDTEWLLTAIRRALVLSANLREDPAAAPWLMALWQQGFRTEYVFYLEADEQAACDALQAQIAADVASATFAQIALLGSYVPLVNMPFVEALKHWAETQSPECQALIQQQVQDLQAERLAREQIPALGSIDDDISRKVQQQYEENPYPRWQREIPVYPLSLQDYVVRRSHRGQWQLPQPSTPQVLIAGCGTGHHACEAASFLQGAEILAVDLSRASLGYAVQMATKHGFSQISFLQADILQLGKLGRKFHLIECGGVLHHMDDWKGAWKLLTELLEPHGIMKIALYSRIARRAVIAAREDIAARGFAATAPDIRRYRKEMVQNGITAENARVVLCSDFFSLSECRDLLFHVQEHNLDLPTLQAAMEELGLEFGGFEFVDTGLREHYAQHYPNDPQGLNLAQWHAFEQQNPDTFRNMYQFWVQKR